MSKSGRPNLSLAGKREAPAQPKQNRGGGSSNRGAGRGRGGGRGRGAGPRQRPDLIQTGGVFSEGLGGAFPNKKKEKDTETAQFRVPGFGGGPSSSNAVDKKEEVKEEIKTEGKASFEGWDELWRSDEEGDDAILRSLNPKGFVTDLRRGNVMPVVLPLDDQSQFLNVINKSARLSLEEEGQVEEEDKKPTTSEPTNNPKKKTPDQLIRMLENSQNDLLHLQLPSVVAAICNKIETTVEIPMEIDDPDNEVPTGVPPPPAPPSGLPHSRRIGKIQVTQKGRLILQVGGHSIDITSKPIAGKQQGTVLLEVDPAADLPQPPSTFGQPTTAFENSLYHLGNVKHNLVGSMTWSTLNEKDNKEEENGVTREIDMRDETTTVQQDREKIQELQQEQAKWADFAARWATGLPTS